MYSKQTKIVNRSGLHARPASDFVIQAKKFESEITIRKLDDENNAANAKSIVSILASGFSIGTEIEISADGSDEVNAVDCLTALVGSGFAE